MALICLNFNGLRIIPTLLGKPKYDRFPLENEIRTGRGEFMVKTFKINKMSRDKDPVNMQLDSMQVHLKTNISQQQIYAYFKAKLVEESLEVQEAVTKDELIEELADCLEVIQGLCKAFALPMEQILDVKQKKRNKRGGFEEGMIIDTVDIPEDHIQAEIFGNQPEKYPLA
jgi:predicted house-cleaning noncanonical NTP pyrophosphatase (MazG superfamily)